MINIQETVDDLLIPGKFPPPTTCQYYGKDFPVSLQHAVEPLSVKRLTSYAKIEWGSNNFQGQNKICYLGIYISKLNIYVYTIPNNFEEFLWPHLTIVWSSTDQGRWQKFISTELPKWFQLAGKLIPMQPI